MGIRLGLFLLCMVLLIVELKGQEIINSPVNRKERLRKVRCFSYKWLPELKKFIEQRKLIWCNSLVLENMKQLPKESKKVMCNMPSLSATNVTYTNPHGCGPCLPGTKGSGCEECKTRRCNAKKPIMCYQGAAASLGKPSSCGNSSVSVCSGPDSDSDVDFACGPCPEGTKGKTCKECIGRVRGACNGPKKVTREYKCATYEFDPTIGLPVKQKKDTVCQAGFLDADVCNRPSYTVLPYKGDIPIIPSATTYTNTNSCGPCKNDSIACQECDSRLCNDIPIKCYQSKFGIFSPLECEWPNEKKCRKPIFNNYIGFKNQNYNCGGCKKGTKDKCEECTGSYAQACNAPPTLGPDFKCYNYTWDGRVLRDLYRVEEVRCLRLPGVPAICNMPGSRETRGNITVPLGCGPCPKEAKSSGMCEECNGELCNVLGWSQSGPEMRVQVAVTVLLLLALAHLFG